MTPTLEWLPLLADAPSRLILKYPLGGFNHPQEKGRRGGGSEVVASLKSARMLLPIFITCFKGEPDSSWRIWFLLNQIAHAVAKKDSKTLRQPSEMRCSAKSRKFQQPVWGGGGKAFSDQSCQTWLARSQERSAWWRVSGAFPQIGQVSWVLIPLSLRFSSVGRLLTQALQAKIFIFVGSFKRQL